MCFQTSFYHGAPEGSIPNGRFYYKYLETYCDELAKIKGAALKVIGLLQQPLLRSCLELITPAQERAFWS